MDSDEIYKFIGYTVAVIFFIYLISKAFSMNVRLIEGLATKETSNPDKKRKKVEERDQKEISDLIKEKKVREDDLADSLAIPKNKKKYAEYLTTVYNSLNYSMIDDVLSTTTFTPDDSKDFNEKKQFLDTIEFLYNSLDRLSDSDPNIDSSGTGTSSSSGSSKGSSSGSSKSSGSIF